jgi:hypothetical protein
MPAVLAMGKVLGLSGLLLALLAITAACWLLVLEKALPGHLAL